MDLDGFLNWQGPLFDVRSPAEYQKGHIPGALSLPLFTDEERSLVGTLYKQHSPDSAYLKGLDLVAPKLSSFAKTALEYRGSLVRIYCWRGGSRSQSMAWLFRLMGISVETLDKGYKAYRKRASNLDPLIKEFHFVVLGGWTGAGKSDFLREQKRYPILDLEQLALHRGSAFGEIQGQQQPSQEHFENKLYDSLRKIPKGSTILVEDESRLIGKIQIPEPLFQRVVASPLLFLDLPKEKRVLNLLENYTILPSAVTKIQKKLGMDRTRKVQSLLENNERQEAASILLEYYDAVYAHALKKRVSNIEYFQSSLSLKEALNQT